MSDVVGDPIVERVAEALYVRWFAGNREWAALTGLEREHWRNMARSAIEALGLTEEWTRENVNGYRCGTYQSAQDAQHHIDREQRLYQGSVKPSWPARRLVSPWERVGGDA